MKKADRFKASEIVVARDLGGEVVLLDLVGGTYFGLNDVGAQIWWAIEADKSVGEICALIVSKFDVDHATANNDVADLVKRLLEKGLIVPAEQSS